MKDIVESEKKKKFKSSRKVIPQNIKNSYIAPYYYETK